MSSIQNCFKGNFTLRQEKSLITIETKQKAYEFCEKLLGYTFTEIQKAPNNWGSRSDSIYRDKITSTETWNNIIIKKIRQDDFIIELQNTYNASEIIKGIFQTKQGAQNLINLLETLVKEKMNQALDKKQIVLLVQGLDTLSVYYDDKQLLEFFNFINHANSPIKDTFLLIPTDNLRDNIVTYIESLAMCRAFVNDTIYDIEKDTMIGQCVFIYNRPSGYSTFEKFEIINDNVKANKGQILFKKPTIVQAPDQEMEKLKEMMKTATFNLGITESQKEAKSNLVLPYFQAQTQDNFEWENKTKLMQLEEQGLDEEQSDDDDLDVQITSYEYYYIQQQDQQHHAQQPTPIEHKASKFECNICLEIANEPVITTCGHLFCWPCIHSWLYSNQEFLTCPVCKNGVTINSMIPVYTRDESANQQDTQRRNIPNRPVPNRRAPYRNPNALGQNGVNLSNMNLQNGVMLAGYGFFPSLFNLVFQVGNKIDDSNAEQRSPEIDELPKFRAILIGVIILLIYVIIFVN